MSSDILTSSGTVAKLVMEMKMLRDEMHSLPRTLHGDFTLVLIPQ